MSFNLYTNNVNADKSIVNQALNNSIKNTNHVKNSETNNLSSIKRFKSEDHGEIQTYNEDQIVAFSEKAKNLIPINNVNHYLISKEKKALLNKNNEINNTNLKSIQHISNIENKNSNEKILVHNLFKEYKLKNTNQKRKLIVNFFIFSKNYNLKEDKISLIDQRIKSLDDQIKSPMEKFSPKLFSSKLVVNPIVNAKKPRTLKLSDDIVIICIK